MSVKLAATLDEAKSIREELLAHLDVHNEEMLRQFATDASTWASTNAPRRSNGKRGWGSTEAMPARSALSSLMNFLGGGAGSEWSRGAFAVTLATWIDSGRVKVEQNGGEPKRVVHRVGRQLPELEDFAVALADCFPEWGVRDVIVNARRLKDRIES